ncbi:MAG: nucleotidyltransferase family protein [Phycisphaerales bacterium]|nr:nucleotidyltransferase family protein [Phycisphaerales bacterium]
MKLAINIPIERLADFCQRWKVAELSLFGSVLRDDFGPESDVDVLVEFLPGAAYGIDEHVAMVAELREMFGRPVDLVRAGSLKNPFRRHEILTTRRVIHAA